MKLKYDKTIYIISWTCGAWKSTIAHALADYYEKSAHIDSDYLYHMVVGSYKAPWEDRDKALSNILWTNINSIANNFILHEFTPVIDYVTFPESLHYLQDLQQKNNLKLKYVVLMADEQTLVSRDAQRDPDCVMWARVIELLHKFKERNIDPKFIIDTSHKTVEEVVQEIINEDRFVI